MDSEVLEKLNSFFQNYTPIKGKKGDIFIHAEEEPNGIFYVQSGLVRQYAVTTKGEELTINIYKHPSFFPMMWAINDVSNKFYFEAMSDVELWRAPKDSVIDFLKSDPDILFDLVSRLYRGIDGVVARIIYLMSGNSRAKVIYTILNLYYRFGQSDKHLTHKELAAISGTTRETFSREIKKLEKEGLIKVANGIVIIPLVEKLEEALMDVNRDDSPMLL
jgi:CRP/FNR family transcriptional regulator